MSLYNAQEIVKPHEASAISACDSGIYDSGKSLSMFGYGELIVRVLTPRGLQESSRIDYPSWQSIRSASRAAIALMWQKENAELISGQIKRAKRFNKASWRVS